MNIKNMLALFCLLVALSPAPVIAQVPVQPQAQSQVPATNAATPATSGTPKCGSHSPADGKQVNSNSASRERTWRLLHTIRITILVLILIMLINSRRSYRRRRW